jgi:sugar lactone lactonase YvrE
MRRLFAFGFLGMFLWFLSSTADAQKIETVNGVRVVHNVKGGQWGKNPQVSIKLFQTIGDLNTEDENLAFNSPSDIAMDPAGNIYILDAGNQRIQKFSPEGKYLATIGRRGQGPGEFNYPRSLDIDPKGNLYVLDSIIKKVKILTAEGAEQKTILILKDSLTKTRFLKSGLFAAGVLIGLGSRTQDDKMDSKLIKIIDQSGNAQKEFGNIVDYGDRMSTYYGNIVSFDTDKNDNIYLSFMHQNRVEKYSPEGQLLWKADRTLNYGTDMIEKGRMEGGNISPPKMNIVSAGITADEKGRAWVVTLNRQIKKEEQVITSMLVTSGGVAKTEIKGNRDLQTTDMYKLEIYSPEGILLGEIPLNQFVSYIRIIKDNLFLIDSDHGAKIYQYKIVEK